MALINKLEAIGDAIRSKTGGSSDLTLDQMVTEIGNISGGSNISNRNISDAEYCFGGQVWNDELYSLVKDHITFNIDKNSTDLSYAFHKTGIEHFTQEIIFSPNTNYTISMIQICNYSNLVESPKINWNGHAPSMCSYAFANCPKMKRIITDTFKNVNWNTFNSGTYFNVGNLFNSSRQLRSIPSEVLKHLYTSGTSITTHQIYYNGLSVCYSLDELVGLPVPRIKITSNMFGTYFADNCWRLKEVIFDTDNGTPYVVNWSNQSINLYRLVNDGKNLSSSIQEAYTANNLVRVNSQADYELYKNTNDWYVHGPQAYKWSRYDHDSAVRTINSLPDVSQGSGNSIHFNGSYGAETDAGAISTLTEEEIAVAAAKGWTVALG